MIRFAKRIKKRFASRLKLLFGPTQRHESEAHEYTHGLKITTYMFSERSRLTGRWRVVDLDVVVENLARKAKVAKMTNEANAQ